MFHTAHHPRLCWTRKSCARDSGRITPTRVSPSNLIHTSSSRRMKSVDRKSDIIWPWGKMDDCVSLYFLPVDLTEAIWLTESKTLNLFMLRKKNNHHHKICVIQRWTNDMKDTTYDEFLTFGMADRSESEVKTKVDLWKQYQKNNLKISKEVIKTYSVLEGKPKEITTSTVYLPWPSSRRAFEVFPFFAPWTSHRRPIGFGPRGR